MPRPLNDAQGRLLHSFWDFWLEGLEAPRHDLPHMEMAEFASDFSQPQKLMLVPRGTWKTSMLSTAFPLWMGLRSFFLDENPSFRSLIDSETTRNSKLILDAIAAYLQNGKNLKAIFGNFYDSTLHKADSLDFTFNEKRSGGIKEPNFLASGLKSAKTGLHFDLIQLDDLVSKENYHTLAMREKVWEHYRMMYSIKVAAGDENTYLNVVGTRYHDDDMYGRILKGEKERVAEGEPPEFATMIRSAIDDDGTLFFPDMLTEEVLKKLKHHQRGLFWANYFNDPNKESAPFKREQLHYLPLVTFPKSLRLRRMTVDPAIKEDQLVHGDYNCMIVGAWNDFGQPYLLDVSLQRDLNLTAFLELFFTMASRWQPEQILIEEASGSLIAETIRKEMQQRKMFFPVFFIKTQKLQGKMTRWLKMQPYADRGGIHLADEIPATTKAELEDQWSRAPFASYDDFMDALEMQTTWMAQTTPDEGGKTFDVEAAVARAMDPSSYDPGHQSLEQIFPHIRALAAKSRSDYSELVSASPENEEEMMLTGGVNWQ